MHQPNFLLLDEPTNDLDLAMMENLEEYLSNYAGCLLVSSHDRAFLDLVCDELFVLDGSATIRYHTIGYSEYQEQAKAPAKRAEVPTTSRPQRQKRQRLSNFEEKELERLEERLGQLSADIVRLEESFVTNHPTEDGTIEERTEAYHEKRRELKECEAAWLALAERA
jgi:ATP-binding cassette subfamily F protein uup